MSSVTLTGELHAALQACLPDRLPAWITDTSPRCGTGTSTSVELTADQEEQLADLIALAWWECEQAADDQSDPFTAAFAAACARYLDATPPRTA